jgi:hypothetical protein
MPLEEKKYDTIADNDWAKDIKGDPIHINNAKSGLQGYYCLGCDKEMQAVKFKNPKYHSYFRHHAHNVDKDKTECVIASKIYRERLAEQILHRLRRLKVPSLYKYAPKGINGQPNLIQESKIVKAFKVKSQLSFYEDEDGNINYGKNLDIENRYLLIRPDVTFFNEKDEPILFIEFVITHKLPPDKKVKLHRLGIDTVQIIIPKLPENEIEESLKSVRKIKWVYNEIEANTNYVFIPKGDTEGISSIDEDQRRLFEESFKCRTAQINNLIRDINLCLRSKSYRRAERHFESEISRIERATKAERQGLEDVERRFESEIRTQLAGEFQAIEFQEEQFNREERGFQKESTDLENRYFDKIKDIRKEQNAINSLTEEELEDHRTEEVIKYQFRDKKEGLEGDFIAERKRFERNIETQRNRIEGFLREKSNLTGQFEQLERDAQNEFEETSRKLEQEETNLNKTVREEFYREVRTNTRKFSKGVRNILEAQRMGYDFENAKREENGYKRARELFIKGTWQKR